MIINEERLKELCLFKGQMVDSKIEDIDLQDPKFTSENYQVIKKLTQKVNEQYYYFYIVQCKKCGELKKIYASDWRNQKVRNCRKCLSLSKRESHIGYENNTYKVISVNIERSNQNGKRVYYDVLCKNCGAKLVLRWDAIKEDTKNGRCWKCCGNNKTASSNAVYNILYNRYKQNAISRNFNYELTYPEFYELITQDCHYCGQHPIEVQSLKRYNHTGQPIYTNGIDRIDSSKGYSKDNCVPCCEVCNRMKLDYDLDFFYNHIEKIYNYHKSLTTIEKTSKEDGTE